MDAWMNAVKATNAVAVAVAKEATTDALTRRANNRNEPPILDHRSLSPITLCDGGAHAIPARQARPSDRQ